VSRASVIVVFSELLSLLRSPVVNTTRAERVSPLFSEAGTEHAQISSERIARAFFM